MSALRFDDWDLPSAPSATTVPATSPAKTAESTPSVQSIEVPTAPADASTELGLAPINAADKRIVNGKADINQLAPFKYPWAWEFFLKANRNHWTPLEIGMAQDVHDYHHKLSGAERHVFENVLAYLTTSDILAMRNIGLAVMEKMSAPEIQIYQARQVYEEALHTWTYQHCIESIGLDRKSTARLSSPIVAWKRSCVRTSTCPSVPTCMNSRFPTSSSRSSLRAAGSTMVSHLSSRCNVVV